MSDGPCATPEQLAAGTVDAAHLAACLACRRELYEQRAIRTSLAWVRMPPLAVDRRRVLAAEVMARADLRDAAHGPRSRSRRARVAIAVGGLALAAAAAVLVVVAGRDEVTPSSSLQARQPASPGDTSGETSPPSASSAATPPPVATEPVPVGVKPDRRHDPQRTATSETVDPTRKTTTGRAGTSATIDRARPVFGATTNHERAAIERELLVEQSPVEAFRAGWEALRARRYDDAIAAFDRATDPAVAEDAAFWAAIAAQRAGRNSEARERLDRFLVAFPESPHAPRARHVRDALAEP